MPIFLEKIRNKAPTAPLTTAHSSAAPHREPMRDAQAEQTLHEAKVKALQTEHTKALADKDQAHTEALATQRKAHVGALRAKDQYLAQYKACRGLAKQISAEEGNLFHYALQRPNAQGIYERGSFPRVALESHPTSLLARQYAGDFSYVRDSQGAATVHSNPLNWHCIVDYLMYDAVPQPAPPTLVHEAKYWQLDDLVQRLEGRAPPEDLCVATDITDGFALAITMHDFRPRLAAGLKLYTDACGLGLRISAKTDGVYFDLDNDQEAKVQLRWETRLREGKSADFTLRRAPIKLLWERLGNEPLYRLIGADGALHLTLNFKLLD